MAGDSKAARIRQELELRAREIQAGRKGKTFQVIADELGTSTDYVEKVSGRLGRGRPKRDYAPEAKPPIAEATAASAGATVQQAGTLVPGARGVRLVRVRRMDRPTAQRDVGGQSEAVGGAEDVVHQCGACGASVDPTATSCAKCGGRFA